MSALVVVPVHGNRTLPVGTLRSIIRQTGLSDEEFSGFFQICSQEQRNQSERRGRISLAQARGGGAA